MIRTATIDDIPRLVEMGAEFHKSAVANKGLGFVPSDFAKWCMFLMDMGTTTLLVGEDEGKVVGSIAGILSPYYMDFSQILLTEQWWWVDFDHRKIPVGAQLKKHLIQWGKDSGATFLIMSSIDSEKEEVVKRYYRREGFTYMESSFIKEI